MDILLICGIIALFFYFLEKYYKKKLARLKSEADQDTGNHVPIPSTSNNKEQELYLTKEDRDYIIQEFVKNIKPQIIITTESGTTDNTDDFIKEEHSYKIILKQDLPLVVAPEFSDKFNKKYRMQSSSEDNVFYYINLYEMTCTCPDFVQVRNQYDKTDYKRVCKHIYQKIRYFREPLDLSLEQLFLFSMGYFYKETYYETHVTSGKFAGRKVIFGWTDNNQWVSVICCTDKYGTDYKRYGYNLTDKRWSYGQSPHGLAAEIRELLFSYFEITQLD